MESYLHQCRYKDLLGLAIGRLSGRHKTEDRGKIIGRIRPDPSKTVRIQCNNEYIDISVSDDSFRFTGQGKIGSGF